MAIVNSIICPDCTTSLLIKTEVTKVVKIPFRSYFGISRPTTRTLQCPKCTCELSISINISSAPVVPDFMTEPIEEITNRDLMQVFPKKHITTW